MSEEVARILYNTSLIICFTILAVAFNTWVLIFLAILFWGFRKDEE